jgi:hypothetical protein
MADDIKRPKALPDMIPDVKFNLEAQEQFANDKGIEFEHWAAMPSPIGRKDRGDYRRPDSLDTRSEGAFIYKKVGTFKCTMVGNSKSHKYGVAEGGIYDNSTARIVIPKFYKTTKSRKKNQEISLLPGDRIYAKGIDVKVPNYQEVEYMPDRVDVLQFPVHCVEMLEDSQGKEYKQGKDFNINKDGNIKWLASGSNPGVDPDTGNGRIYSIRYKYLAFWYIAELINEIRMTNTDGETPARLPYHAVVQREYVYHNKNRGDAKDSNVENTTERTVQEPVEDTVNLDDYEVKVDIRSFE